MDFYKLPIFIVDYNQDQQIDLDYGAKKLPFETGFGKKIIYHAPLFGDAVLCIDWNGDGNLSDASELFYKKGQSAWDVFKSLDSNQDNMINHQDKDFSKIKLWQAYRHTEKTPFFDLIPIEASKKLSFYYHDKKSNLSFYNHQLIHAFSMRNITGKQSVGFLAEPYQPKDRHEETPIKTGAQEASATEEKGPEKHKKQAALLPYRQIGYGYLHSFDKMISIDPQFAHYLNSFMNMKPENLESSAVLLKNIMHAWTTHSLYFHQGIGHLLQNKSINNTARGFLNAMRLKKDNPYGLYAKSPYLLQAAKLSWHEMNHLILSRLLVFTAFRDIFPKARYDADKDRVTLHQTWQETTHKIALYASKTPKSQQPHLWAMLHSILHIHKDEWSKRKSKSKDKVGSDDIDMDMDMRSHIDHYIAQKSGSPQHATRIMSYHEAEGFFVHQKKLSAVHQHLSKGSDFYKNYQNFVQKLDQNPINRPLVKKINGHDAYYQFQPAIFKEASIDTARSLKEDKQDLFWNIVVDHTSNLPHYFPISQAELNHDIWHASGHKDLDFLMPLSIGTLSGDREANILKGSSMPAIIFGNGGDDIIDGNIEDDILFGNEGHDTIKGGQGADFMIGGLGNDILDGGDDMDTIIGNQGDDKITGGTGNDYIRGGEGADDIDGGPGIDFIDYSFSREAITLDMAKNIHKGGEAEGDSLKGIEGVFGARYDDKITGDKEGNQIFGFGGNDVIDGGDGNDILRGGAGNDRLMGGTGVDLLYGGDGHNLLDGGDGHDQLYGGPQGDTLMGGDGNDFLVGYNGSNSIQGGKGIDMAVHYVNQSYDVIDQQSKDNQVEYLQIHGLQTHHQLWFTINGDNLKIQFMQKNPNDCVIIKNWNHFPTQKIQLMRNQKQALSMMDADIVNIVASRMAKYTLSDDKKNPFKNITLQDINDFWRPKGK